ncbi:hypothetical protein Pla86_07570 [Planctomycetes bacterium Pla86]|uniref:Uncharacterized protein n=1 Tax=Engelhardtia mirabilis TaxID=2528011 RepID=A0A518BFK1_9BACT|nr:hypothetical protein Pla133_07580 [Planctomycetes bacterium Pla133]QDV00019.1 hypothetical protein Pla86_07570 [Planctomycetes bacterium Pla86]
MAKNSFRIELRDRTGVEKLDSDHGARVERALLAGLWRVDQ